MTIINWQNSWDRFVEMLEEEIRNGTTQEELSEKLEGLQIRWECVFNRLDTDESAPNVGLTLPEKVISIPGMTFIPLGKFAPSINCESIPEWSKVKVGEKIQFQATIGGIESPFLPIKMKTFPTGRTLVRISFNEAIPIS